ncbi:hypothetical protein NZK35_01015 [Stieleria sp. ICT_E10.1]|uniref:hypothetical protein n=1 Tax=Stieleria sedimenti TaxID=2976331 RepID=UPI00217F6954|nr:hypothetical protein [Stieleria sedimenti]MCS7465249.1 hypothetical protein [Stieleria sedimenti]
MIKPSLIVCMLLICGGCFPPPASSPASAQKRQAQAIADREEELAFRDESGEMNWRSRVDAAKELLEQAQSNRRWGQSQAALEQALDAARLMPPPGKDFDLETELADLRGEPAGGSEDASAESGSEDEGQIAATGASVTNAEVRQMRKELEALLERLEGSTGRTTSELSLERDLIEIQ